MTPDAALPRRDAGLAVERFYFDAYRERWIQQGHEREWAAVHRTELIGFFRSLEDGYYAGAAMHEPGTFLVKQVIAADDARISRLV